MNIHTSGLKLLYDLYANVLFLDLFRFQVAWDTVCSQSSCFKALFQLLQFRINGHLVSEFLLLSPTPLRSCCIVDILQNKPNKFNTVQQYLTIFSAMCITVKLNSKGQCNSDVWSYDFNKYLMDKEEYPLQLFPLFGLLLVRSPWWAISKNTRVM